MAESGRTRRNTQVTKDGKIESTCQSRPVDRGDERKGETEQRVMEPVAGVPQLPLKVVIVNRKLAQIESSAEGVTFTGHHDAADRIVRAKVFKRCPPFLRGRATERAFFLCDRSKVSVATPSSLGETLMLAITESSQAEGLDSTCPVCRDGAQPDRSISHVSLLVEVARDLVRNLREAGVDRPRASLHEHVTHVPH